MVFVVGELCIVGVIGLSDGAGTLGISRDDVPEATPVGAARVGPR
jgi:hypothetical protein